MGQSQSIPLTRDSGTPVPPRSEQSASYEVELSKLAVRLMFAVNASGVAIAIQSPADPATMVCVARCGDTAPPLGALLDINSGISGKAVRENRTLHSDDTATDPRVDKEACERLGIRSVAAVPISSESRCVGILEVFSNRPGAFDAATLTRIEAEALRSFALVEERPSETKLRDPQNWKLKSPGFELDQAGRLSALQTPSTEIATNHADLRSRILSLLDFPSVSRVLKRLSRWIALASVATSLAFSAPRLLHRRNVTSTSGDTAAITEKHSSAPASAGSLESTTALVSDAAPKVRVLMAKALSGDTVAQASLADHYAAGDGVTRDRVKAAVWAVIARENRNQKTDKSAAGMPGKLQPYEVGQIQFNLGTMLRDGIGTRRDLVNAYAWFLLSEKTGDVRASAALLNLQQVMSASEIAEAQRRAPQLVSHPRK